MGGDTAPAKVLPCGGVPPLGGLRVRGRVCAPRVGLARVGPAWLPCHGVTGPSAGKGPVAPSHSLQQQPSAPSLQLNWGRKEP